MRIRILIFIYTIRFAYLTGIKKLKTLTKIGAEKSVTEISNGSKEKWQNKGLISNLWLFLLHNITNHYQALYQIRILSQVVAKKSLKEKNYRQTDKQTNNHNYRKGKNYILPIYFVLRL